MSSSPKRIALLLTPAMGLLLATVVTAPQASAANLVLAAGSYTANTTTLKLTGPSTNVTGVNIGGVAVFKFGSINIPSGATITATGKRPLELLATNGLVLGGTIVGSGASATSAVPTPGAGGPGGAAGGTGGDTSGVWVPATAGRGPGGGGAPSDQYNGAGGGGFGGKGARGGVDSGDLGTAGTSGAAYGNLNAALQGGSGGGGSSNVGGGGGGGAIALVGSSVTIKSSGLVVANGGDGAGGGNGASGGGSGGGIIVNGKSVQFNGELDAQGGAGGGGGCCGDAGGGAGGRIAIQYQTYSTQGTVTMSTSGGTSGIIDYSHGGLSPDVAGAHGVITFTHIDASVLTIGPSMTVAKGKAVAIGTRLTDRSTAKPIAKQKVTLYKRTSKTGPWSSVTTKTTSATGRASLLVRPKRFTQFQWRYAGGWVHAAAVSQKQSISIAR